MWKKKITCMLLLFLCIGASITVQAQEITTYSEGFYQYHLGEGYVSICKYFGSQEKVNIPSSIAGRPVTIIESDTFDKNSNIKEIYIPDTVTYIEEDVFVVLPSLTKIVADTVDVTISAGSGVKIEYLRGAPANSGTENDENSGNNEETDKNDTENVGNTDKNNSENVGNTDKNDNGNVGNTDKNDTGNVGNTDKNDSGNVGNTDKNNTGTTENSGSIGNTEHSEIGNNGNSNTETNTGSGSNDSDAGEGNGEVLDILDEQEGNSNKDKEDSNKDKEDSNKNKGESNSQQTEQENTSSGAGEHTEHITLEDIKSESDKKPGISIPSKNVTITVNQQQQLVAKDQETGEEQVLDDSKTYTVVEKENGSVEIVDNNGEQVIVKEDGEILFDGKKTINVESSSFENTTSEKQNPLVYILLIGGVVVAVVLYAKRKNI